MTITLEGALNFRDLGGHSTADGRTVKQGLLFRSGSLSTLADDDLAALERIGVRTVVDLRVPSQIETFGPDRIPEGIDHIDLPLGAGELSEIVHGVMRTGRFAELPDLETVNLAILREDRAGLADFLRIAADPGRLPLVFHCIAGKDRTGVAAALVLSILGVPWEAVREDYVRSNEELGRALDAELDALAESIAERSGRPLGQIDLEAAKRFLRVEGSDLDAVRDAMIAEAGSIEAYVVDRLGMSTDTVQSLRNELLE